MQIYDFKTTFSCFFYKKKNNKTKKKKTYFFLFTEQLNAQVSPVKHLQNNGQLIVNPEGFNLTEAAEECSKSSFVA